MTVLVAFDFGGALAESKQTLKNFIGKVLADVPNVIYIAMISGGN
jgi:phosphomannomutase